MTVNDEQISAWLHDGLSVEDAAQMAALVASNPAVAARAERMREIDDLVRKAVPLNDQLPAELLARLGLGAAVSGPALANSAEINNVIPFAVAASARSIAPPARRSRFSGFASGGWRIAAQVLLVVGIGTAGAVWLNGSPVNEQPAEYRVLGDAPNAASRAAASANAMVMFAPAINASRVKMIVDEAGGRIVGDRTAMGAWRLAFAPERRDAALAKLRAHAEVQMAEPLDGGRP